jgi:hypothetical protein
MKSELENIARWLCVGFGLVLIAFSLSLYENEEGEVKNRLEAIWVTLSDAGSIAVRKHAAFMAGIAALTGRLFDRLFGSKLFSIWSVGASACLSLASVAVVCSPGLSTTLRELPAPFYWSLATLLLLMGFAPALLKRPGGIQNAKVLRIVWLVGAAFLVFVTFIVMDVVNWFNLPARPVQMGEGMYLIEAENVEYYYYAALVVIAIASDTIFIATTRWLLRVSSRLDSLTRILALMLGNVLLACVLVIVPLSWAWGVGVVPTVIRSGNIVRTLNYLAGTATSHESFLATLAASNLLDGLVASAFFILFFTLLLHRLIWPIIQRPVYALATRDVVRRRRVIRKIGVALVGVGAFGPDAVKFIEKLAP